MSDPHDAHPPDAAPAASPVTPMPDPTTGGAPTGPAPERKDIGFWDQGTYVYVWWAFENLEEFKKVQASHMYPSSRGSYLSKVRELGLKGETLADVSSGDKSLGEVNGRFLGKRGLCNRGQRIHDEIGPPPGHFLPNEVIGFGAARVKLLDLAKRRINMGDIFHGLTPNEQGDRVARWIREGKLRLDPEELQPWRWDVWIPPEGKKLEESFKLKIRVVTWESVQKLLPAPTTYDAFVQSNPPDIAKCQELWDKAEGIEHADVRVMLDGVPYPLTGVSQKHEFEMELPSVVSDKHCEVLAKRGDEYYGIAPNMWGPHIFALDGRVAPPNPLTNVNRRFVTLTLKKPEIPILIVLQKKDDEPVTKETEVLVHPTRGMKSGPTKKVHTAPRSKRFGPNFGSASGKYTSFDELIRVAPGTDLRSDKEEISFTIEKKRGTPQVRLLFFSAAYVERIGDDGKPTGAFTLMEPSGLELKELWVAGASIDIPGMFHVSKPIKIPKESISIIPVVHAGNVPSDKQGLRRLCVLVLKEDIARIADPVSGALSEFGKTLCATALNGFITNSNLESIAEYVWDCNYTDLLLVDPSVDASFKRMSKEKKDALKEIVALKKWAEMDVKDVGPDETLNWHREKDIREFKNAANELISIQRRIQHALDHNAELMKTYNDVVRTLDDCAKVYTSTVPMPELSEKLSKIKKIDVLKRIAWLADVAEKLEQQA